MNVRNQSDVAYQTSGVEERSKPTGSRQFKGKNMPQGNKMEKKSKAKKSHHHEKAKHHMEKAAHHHEKAKHHMEKANMEKHEKKEKKLIGKLSKMHTKKNIDDRIKAYGKKGSRYE